MRKLLVGLTLFIVLLGSIPLALLATGTISGSSLRMMLNVMAGVSGPGADAGTVQRRYTVPSGFDLQLYAADLPRARFLHVTAEGDLLVSRPHEGDILLLRADRDGDNAPDSREPLLQGLQRPLGLDVANGWLYVAESHRIGRAPFDSESGRITGAYEILVDGLTDNGNHWSKTLRVGPDGFLYLAHGSTCNICEEEDERRATLMRFSPDGGNAAIIATGLRNSVGFDWAPWNGELYATDNGRDLLGDDFPPCELNRIVEGGFYGWPYFNGDNRPDPDMGTDPRAHERQPLAPVHPFRPHNAPLGIAFLDPRGLPDEFQRSALVALHGSWNRSEPDGYKVVSLHWTDKGIVERDFLAGFNQDGDISGRPVDVAQGPDGSIYISDDYAGAIYRVSYGGNGDGQALSLPVTPRLDREPPRWTQDADLAAMADAGEALYLKHGCASCHEEGENPKRLDDLADRLGYNQVIEAMRAPQSPMPVFPLDQEQLRSLAVYLMKRGPDTASTP